MAGGTLVTLDWDQLAQPVNDRAGDRVRAQSSGGHRGHHRAPDHGAAGSQLPAADVVLEEALLDRLDEIVPPGTNLNPADGGWANPALRPTARRR
jgi:hypothetical protein